MYDIPVSIPIKGQSYTIRRKGDYRLVLDCLSCLQDVDLTKEERILACLIIFYEELNEPQDILFNDLDVIEELVQKMFWFFNCGEDLENIPDRHQKLMDWEQDEQLICAAVNKVAGTEVRAVEYMHWWTFMGYYMSIGESFYSSILSIRDKIINGKKLEKHETEFKNKNPQYFIWNSKTAEEQDAEEWIKEIWNSER